ncbi:helix-turn-helix domain-containing protein [Mariniluteicoccus flavus]
MTEIRPEVLAALRFLETRVAEPTTLADVADEVGYSRFHLARAFSATVGVAPMAYLAARRFLTARRMLVECDAKVVDICMEVGFSSLGTFTRRFTDEVGVTPSAFRSLPDRLADAPPRTGHLPGVDLRGGRVEAVVDWAPSASHATNHCVYAGLFPARAARGLPVAGSLLEPGGPTLVLTDVPPGSWWLLAAALPVDDPLAQLVPRRPITGGVPHPISVRPGATSSTRVTLRAPEHWETPITVALPALTSLCGPEPVRPLMPLPAPRTDMVGGRG